MKVGICFQITQDEVRKLDTLTEMKFSSDVEQRKLANVLLQEEFPLINNKFILVHVNNKISGIIVDLYPDGKHYIARDDWTII